MTAGSRWHHQHSRQRGPTLSTRTDGQRGTDARCVLESPSPIFLRSAVMLWYTFTGDGKMNRRAVTIACAAFAAITFLGCGEGARIAAMEESAGVESSEASLVLPGTWMRRLAPPDAALEAHLAGRNDDELGQRSRPRLNDLLILDQQTRDVQRSFDGRIFDTYRQRSRSTRILVR